MGGWPLGWTLGLLAFDWQSQMEDTHKLMGFNDAATSSPTGATAAAPPKPTPNLKQSPLPAGESAGPPARCLGPHAQATPRGGSAGRQPSVLASAARVWAECAGVCW